MISGAGALRGIVRHALPAGLGQRLVLAFLSINLVLSLLATSAQLYASYQRDAAQVFRLIDTIDRSFRDGLTDALWEYNFELVEALLEGVHYKTDVHHVALSTPAGRRWSRGTQASDPSGERRLSFSYAAAGTEPQPVGALTVGLSLDHALERVRSQFWVLLASNFAKSAVASIAMLLLFGHLVTRHLRRIAAHVEDVIDDLRADIARSGALIAVGELPDVSGSPCHVRTLVQNLISNAVKFRSRERIPRIGVRAARDARPGFVRLVVSDNGIGIDAEHRGAVFGLFQRLHGHDAYPGSGVGLALCKRVVENQGGSIDLESTPDVGTTITSSLRRAA